MENAGEIMTHTLHHGCAEGIHTVTMRKFVSPPYPSWDVHTTVAKQQDFQAASLLTGIGLSCFSDASYG